MRTRKEILTTIVVALITGLNLYNLERPVPEPQEAYDNYAYSYLLYLSLSFLAIIGCYALGKPTRITKALLIVNAGAFLLLGVKSYFRISHKHNEYDITFLGCAFIIAAYYLLSNRSGLWPIIKAILNQIYMRWPTRSQRGKPGSS